MSLLSLFILGIVSVVCGIINVLAGGGSNLMLPLLMTLGLDPQTANATNRVGIWCQSVAGIAGFKRANALPTSALRTMLAPLFVGAFIGALLAAKLDWLIGLSGVGAYISEKTLMKWILLGTMFGVAILTLFYPQTVLHQPNTERAVKDTPIARYGLFFAGLYGGFVQAGVGFVLLSVLAGTLHYDLARANALKLCATLFFTSLALLIFIWQGQVLWTIGAMVAIGNALGASIGVRFALTLRPTVIRWLLFFMTLAALISALI